ncbi:NUDIX hydrolase [Pontibacter sp. 172403-2]|uniref:NUDIX domain-containing protein n=1 Tax=Pontibacter rufus TaxID=2791028 RepID=UPI0018B00755|nr:NUDIX hydrolase [Pontibacter sp. 172403-2]MBF9254457.1 NUDIX hydrolase [Pontibacter sp. 172403-2]
MQIKGQETIYEGFYTFRKLIVEEDGDTFEREQFVSGNAAAALVYDTQQDKYIFVKQYRYSAEMNLLETVAGVVENGDPEKTIRKEIAEETGYKVDRLEHIWDFFTSPGACTEKVHLYYAEVSGKERQGGGLDEEHEHIQVVALTEAEMLRLRLMDAKTIIALQWLAARKQTQLRHPETTL